jgi:subtilisin family serine protease
MDIGLERAWDVPLVDYTLKIAVLDSGFHFEHPDKWNYVSTTEDYDFVFPSYSYTRCVYPSIITVPRDWDGGGYDDDALQMMDLAPPDPFDWKCPLVPNPSGSHGTIVTGTIASAWNNGEGGVGALGGVLLVDPGSPAAIVPIQVLDVAGRANAYDVAQGVGYASGFWVSNGHGSIVQISRRADIANMSFGTYLPSFYELLATQLAYVNGMLMIASAGNEATPLPHFPSGFPWVISVSNFDTDEDLASDSNFGKVDLTAPGVDIYTTSYDYSGCGPLPFVPCLGVTGGAPSYATAGGTSLSAPHVTGIAALYKANHDSATNVDLTTMLLGFAADWGTPGPDIQFGSGLVQAAPGRGAALVSARGARQAYLVSAANGAVRTAPVAAMTGNYQFLNVPAGWYTLVAAADPDGDGVYAETGEAVGAGAGGGALQNAQARFWPGGNLLGTVNFTLDWPGVETEPGNNAHTGAGATFVGFYVEATYSGAGDTDWFRFRVPSDGFYRIWTEGRNTIQCREDLNEMDPKISLYLDAGLAFPALLATDSNSGEGNCAEIPSFWLEQGKPYYVEVTSEGAAPVVGFATILHVDGP